MQGTIQVLHNTMGGRYMDKAQISITKMRAPILLVLPWGEVSNFKKNVLLTLAWPPITPE